MSTLELPWKVEELLAAEQACLDSGKAGLPGPPADAAALLTRYDNELRELSLFEEFKRMAKERAPLVKVAPLELVYASLFHVYGSGFSFGRIYGRLDVLAGQGVKSPAQDAP